MLTVADVVWAEVDDSAEDFTGDIRKYFTLDGKNYGIHVFDEFAGLDASMVDLIGELGKLAGRTYPRYQATAFIADENFKARVDDEGFLVQSWDMRTGNDFDWIMERLVIALSE